jgi:transcriptional regulator with XRE-family HTH domain
MSSKKNINKIIADRLYEIRMALDLSQLEMSRLLDIHYQYISALENGRRKPGFKLTQRYISLCKAHDINIDNSYLRPDCT